MAVSWLCRIWEPYNEAPTDGTDRYTTGLFIFFCNGTNNVLSKKYERIRQKRSGFPSKQLCSNFVEYVHQKISDYFCQGLKVARRMSRQVPVRIKCMISISLDVHWDYGFVHFSFIIDLYIQIWIVSKKLMKFSAFSYVKLLQMLLISLLYAWMFVIIRGDRQHARPVTLKRREDSVLAFRFFLIVLTDCLCWIPIIAIKLAALCKVKISRKLENVNDTESKWTFL